MPTSDNQVVERLQPRKGPLWDEVRLQRSRLEGAPDSAAPRLAIARTYLQIHQGTGDPRFLGYAEAALLPWAHSSPAPLDVSLVRVHLLQAQHQFDKAAKLLDEILQRDSRQPDAWLQLASINQLRGDFTAARRACAHLIALGEPAIASGCLAAVQGMTGASAAGLDLLARQLAADAEPAPAISIWLRTLSAELATGLQRYPEAEEQFRR
ncbi:MAG: tetratricopeptide repeat protein, partial [Gammaproteobacteria bacterium]